MPKSLNVSSVEGCGIAIRKSYIRPDSHFMAEHISRNTVSFTELSRTRTDILSQSLQEEIESVGFHTLKLHVKSFGSLAPIFLQDPCQPCQSTLCSIVSWFRSLCQREGHDSTYRRLACAASARLPRAWDGCHPGIHLQRHRTA